MHVLISGAGIAGPTLAYFLSQRPKTKVTIVEKSASLLAQGQNIDIRSSAITVIKKMNLLAEIKKYNTTEKGLEFIDAQGKAFAPFPVREGSSSSPTSEFEILRGDLASVLYEATKDLVNVEYVFGKTVEEVMEHENDQGRVTVRWSDGGSEKFDLLVAADGQWSKTRKRCFAPESITVVDKGLYVVYWTVARLPEDNDFWRVYQALGSRVLTLRPDPHGTIRACVSIMPCNDAQKQAWHNAARSDRKVQHELLRREFADAGWCSQRLLDSLDQADDLYFQAVQQIRMIKWSTSRVVCLGDAAHAPTPLTGMGTSLAIIGAYILAGELSKIEEDQDPSPALEAYETVFRPYVEQIQKIPFFIPAIGHPMTAWKRWLLQSVVSLVSKVMTIPWLSSLFEQGEGDRFALPVYPVFDPKH